MNHLVTFDQTPAFYVQDTRREHSHVCIHRTGWRRALGFCHFTLWKVQLFKRQPIKSHLCQCSSAGASQSNHSYRAGWVSWKLAMLCIWLLLWRLHQQTTPLRVRHAHCYTYVWVLLDSHGISATYCYLYVRTIGGLLLLLLHNTVFSETY